MVAGACGGQVRSVYVVGLRIAKREGRRKGFGKFLAGFFTPSDSNPP